MTQTNIKLEEVVLILKEHKGVTNHPDPVKAIKVTHKIQVKNFRHIIRCDSILSVRMRNSMIG